MPRGRVVDAGTLVAGRRRRPRPSAHVAAQPTTTPAARSASLTCPTVSSPKWKTLAASTASAPASTAGAKCWAAPAPPLAMTGTDTAARTRRMSSRSKPSLVPSASMELSRISPAPRSAARAHHSTASRSTGVRPPWVVITKSSVGRPSSPIRRRTSAESTSTWAPKRSAISAMSSGRAMAAVLTPTLSAPARRRRSTSSTVRTPPPTVSGMKTCSAVRRTTS